MKTITQDEIRAAFKAGSEAKECICAIVAENLCEANAGGDFRYNDGGFIACNPCLNVTAYVDVLSLRVPNHEPVST